MFWLRKLGDLLNALFSVNGHRAELVEEPATKIAETVVDKPLLRKDEMLSVHFSLFELTATSNTSLQAQNRTLTNNQMDKLIILANHAEVIREICGAAVKIHSGYRSSLLNGVTLGSSSTSQHPKCEALDLDVKGQSVEDTFNKLLAAARAKKFRFGQLILEKAERSCGVAMWVHCSVVGTLAPEKVGQVLRMDAGIDGKPKYTLIDHLKFPEL